MTDDRTTNLNLALPHADNFLVEDVARLRATLQAIDAYLHSLQGGITTINDRVGVDIASLVDGKIPAIQLPSYVDDVLEYATLAAFPGAGEAGKIYVALDTDLEYRWTGTVYRVISKSPGTTDDVTEGAVNKYFTDARARAAQLPATASTLGVVRVGSGLAVGLDGALSTIGSGGGEGLPAFNELVLVPTVNGQTVFEPVGGYSVGEIDVYLNGSLLIGNGDDYTAADGVQIVLTAGVNTGDSLLLRRWTTADSLPFAALTDKPTTRDGYGITDVPLSAEALLKAGNLGGLEDVAAARTNLGLGTAAQRAAVGAGDLYSRGGILGAVSQSGGVPTGAIIEAGNNANGYFTKFADGTMICRHVDSTARTTSSASGSVYFNGAISLTFPVPFVGNLPHVAAFAQDSNVAPVWVSGASPSLTGANSMYLLSTVSTAYAKIGYIAIGRWF